MMNSVGGDGCFMHQCNTRSHEQHFEFSPLRPMFSSDSGDINPFWLVGCRYQGSLSATPQVLIALTNHQ